MQPPLRKLLEQVQDVIRLKHLNAQQLQIFSRLLLRSAEVSGYYSATGFGAYPASERRMWDEVAS